jgi:hypothetical protein
MRSHIDSQVTRTYDEPTFLEPLTSRFLYAAWSVDPVTVGPFVRPSAKRRRKIGEILALAAGLTQLPGIEGLRVFEASFIPPLPDMPRYDVLMLVRTQDRERAGNLANDAELRRAEPAAIFLADNAARFGVTEDGRPGVNFLLNHFTGTSDRSAAEAAWRRISGWYVAKMGMDNSTLLRTEESAPFAIINYVRLPGKVVPFLLGQIFRPSFHRYVRGVLKEHQLTPLPLFVKEVRAE